MVRHLPALVSALVVTLLGFLPLPAFAAVKVVTTTEDLAALAREVGGTRIDVSAIARGDLDPHFVEPKPSYMVKLSTADLVVSVGLDLEIGWLGSLIQGARNPRIQTGSKGFLDASVAIEPIGVPTGTVDRSKGDVHPQGNPHYWLDPENGRAVARLIAGRLTQLDPANAAAYQESLADFERRLDVKKAEWATKMAPLRGAKVVAYHRTFDYFTTFYGMETVGFVEPRPGIPPTPSHTLQLASAAKAAGARFIFVEPYHDPSNAGPIATASGAKVVVLPTSVGAEAQIESYFDLYDAIVRRLTA